LVEDRIRVLREVEPCIERVLDSMPRVEENWQPSDVLPSFGSPGWREELDALREEASRLTDEMWVVLVGNVVTEEALPSYLCALNRFDGAVDRTGTDAHPWARWARAWTAEENRHGDVTRAYLQLAGRVDLRSVERTIQHLLRNGFDSRADGDPYRGLSYASFQEHATKTCWSQLGTLAGSVGAPVLHRICGMIASDEARHERAYVSVLTEVVRRDPDGALEALEATLGRTVVMPAQRMTDGEDRDLFGHFAAVGQRIGVYTHVDYVENLAQLVATLGIDRLENLSPAAEASREAVFSHIARHRNLAESPPPRRNRSVRFSWIHGRSA
jgi:acyl-[acyl-carrier-protein] desaturase